MAFALDALIRDYEVRGVTAGTSAKGNEFRSLRLESMGGYALEVSCTKPELFASIDRLQKGDMINADVRAVSGRDRSYVSLMSAPDVMGNSYKD